MYRSSRGEGRNVEVFANPIRYTYHTGDQTEYLMKTITRDDSNTFNYEETKAKRAR